MALQESLAKFKQQQEKCQLTLTNLTARAGLSNAAQSHKAVPAATSSSVAARAPAVKFSNDTARLQHINGIRNGPVGAQIKRVIDLLLETRQAFTPEQINEATYVDVNANRAVFNSLRNNLKVHYDGQRFSYKSKHGFKDKDELLHLIQKNPEGIRIIELKDAYPTVVEDLKALKAAGKVWLLSNSDSKEEDVASKEDAVAYPNDTKILIKVDEALRELFQKTELPCDMIDIEKDLQKNGIKPLTNSAKRRAMAQVHGITRKTKAMEKQRAISKRTRLTNAHLPELFNNLYVPDT